MSPACSSIGSIVLYNNVIETRNSFRYINRNRFCLLYYYTLGYNMLPEASLGQILHGELSLVLCFVSILGRLFARTRAAWNLLLLRVRRTVHKKKKSLLQYTFINKTVTRINLYIRIYYYIQVSSLYWHWFVFHPWMRLQCTYACITQCLKFYITRY